MTTLAVGKVVAAERPLVVMTGGAARRIARRKMHRGQRRRDLFSASRTGSDRVTARAVHRLQMFRMRERGRISLRPFRGAAQPSGLMTGSARSHRITRTSRVTLKTAGVRACSRRNRKSDAAAGCFVTGRAVRPQMFGVVKPRVKTPQRRKTFDARRCMTDRADRMRVIGKLLRMAARARRMTGKSRSRRIVVAPVTDETRQPVMDRV